MIDTFSEISGMIIKNYDVAAENVRPESHMLEDLGLDSVDLYDLVFEIEEKFDISLEPEKWMTNAAASDPAQSVEFTLGAICQHVDALRAERAA